MKQQTSGVLQEPMWGGLAATPANPDTITIRQVANGFIATVGCKTFVALNLEDVFEGLKLYFTNPEAAYKKYYPKKETVS